MKESERVQMFKMQIFMQLPPAADKDCVKEDREVRDYGSPQRGHMKGYKDKYNWGKLTIGM